MLETPRRLPRPRSSIGFLNVGFVNTFVALETSRDYYCAFQRSEGIAVPSFGKAEKVSVFHARHYMQTEMKITAYRLIDKFSSLLEISRPDPTRKRTSTNMLNIITVRGGETARCGGGPTIFLLDKDKGELWAKVALGVFR